MSKISEEVEKKKFLMDLIMKGQRESTEDVLGAQIVFRTLNDEDTTDAHKEASGFDMISRVAIVRKALLSRAIVSIAFKDAGIWTPKSVEDASAFIGKLAPILVEHIFNKYDVITKIRDSVIEQALGADTKDELKN